MNFEEILKKTSEEIDEILALKKSYDESQMMAKEQPEAQEAPASDGASDAVHAADEGGDVASYAQNLSDEELYSLLSSLSEEAEARGIGEDQAPASAEQAPAGEEASPEGVAQEDSQMAPQLPAEVAEGQEGGEMSGDGEAPAEGANGAEGSIESKIAGLADEELSMLMSAVEAELSARSGGQPEAAAPAAPAPAAEPLKESMGKMEKSVVDPTVVALQKSISDLANVVTSLNSKISNLEKSTKVAAPAKTEVPAKQYASPKVKVLEKSEAATADSYLEGQDLQNWLLSEQRGKNKKVKSDLVVAAGLMKSQEDAAGFYAELKKLGLTPPKK